MFILFFAAAGAQSANPPKPALPLRDDRVTWSRQFSLPGGPRQRELFRRLQDALSTGKFGTGKFEVTTADPETGTILGTAILPVPVGDSGKQYLLRCNWAVVVHDSCFTFAATHFYEKLIGIGTTTEYSKIEYRWWDFRHGHPWGPNDAPLFAGMDSMMSQIMDDLFRRVNVPRWHVLALYENGGHHIEYSRRARVWLGQLAADSNFTVDYLTRPDSITDRLLSHYQLFLQLDYPPYGWKPAAMAAFQRYIGEGRGGWIGFHHASLLGEFDGFPMWDWFHDFMGGIRWKDYIGRFANGTVRVEDHAHPLMAGIPDSFTIDKEEWYTYDRSPRPGVHVLAHVDESTYVPDTTIKMGDHPVIWTNEHVRARNAYIFMGHSPALFDNPVYTRLFANAISWAASAPGPPRPAIANTAAANTAAANTAAANTTAGANTTTPGSAAAPRFRVLAFFSTNVEQDHVDFAHDAIRFYAGLAVRDHFAFDTTSNWDNCDSVLSHYQVVLWLNEFPNTEAQRSGFENYMEHGGAWLGFHVSAYNDKDTHWPWFVRFLGGAVFYNNSWPPLPAKLIVEDTRHGATHRLPSRYTAPINEWYGWRPDPRSNPDVRVLITLDPANFPLGKKDILHGGGDRGDGAVGDIPVVWTNTKYRMLYLNMGHGDQNFASPLQNRLFEDALLWLGSNPVPRTNAQVHP
jgi:type 1 glutamine amidotransferase